MNSGNKKEKKKQTIAHIRIVQEILKRWDPMDLAPGEFAPADEYDTYAPHIVSLVAQGCSVEDLLGHLQKLRNNMVCRRDDRKRDTDVAKEIIAALRSETV